MCAVEEFKKEGQVIFEQLEKMVLLLRVPVYVWVEGLWWALK